MKPKKLTVLGSTVRKFTRLETFARPADCKRVVCISDEVTSNCPKTGQPDWYVVEIDYVPDSLCVESKSLKLYLQSFRNRGLFCEAFASCIAQDLFQAMSPRTITVTVRQKPRGGIAIHATSTKSSLALK